MTDNQPNRAVAGNGICIVAAADKSFQQEIFKVLHQRFIENQNIFGGNSRAAFMASKVLLLKIIGDKNIIWN